MSQLGATSIIMERFDAEAALAAIERYGVTHSQWVPTMFVRLLQLADKTRLAHDLSSHEVAIHAAAPCPVSVKERMMAWWGPILCEYYGASEGGGVTTISSAEWREHRGSVGRSAIGKIRIVGDDGYELPPGEVGLVHFEGGRPIEYLNDREKTRNAYNGQGWASVGDIGYLDDDGYLYLVDRKEHMIISGGVNIYPQEAEDVLIHHHAVSDVAVIGVPNEEFGEEVRAVVQLAQSAEASDELAEELLRFCRTRLTHYKCPRSIDFVDELPRVPSGKLYKRKLRERYWRDQPSGLI
jgi:acyl-CoA synthetase (AMP-forming)/AMP-acid ligase II